MIDKVSGKVAFAVTSFGGFLGMGEDYYPLPCSQLKSDPNPGGYRTNLTEAQPKGRRIQPFAGVGLVRQVERPHGL